MAELTPEKRIDRNGRAVTRHVRAAGTGRAHAPLPPPSVAARQASSGKPYRPTAKQLATDPYPMLATRFTPDRRLHTSEGESRPEDGGLTYFFEANMVEIYNVVGACTRSADAIKLLSLGIRHPGEARDYLHLHGCDDLIADRSALAQAALERGLEPFDGLIYLDSYADPGVEPRAAADAARFSTTSIYAMDGAGKIALDIAEGLTSFDDVRAIGIGRLKATGNLSAMREVLRRMHTEPPQFTADGIRAVLDRAKRERVTGREHKTLAEVLIHGGEDRTMAAKGLMFLCDLVRAYGTASPEDPRRLSPGEAVERALYHDALGVRATDYWMAEVREAYEAGVPVEVAQDVFAGGGDAMAAIAVHEGVASGLAGGWI